MEQIYKSRKKLSKKQLDKISENDLKFQALTWYEGDFDVEDGDGDDDGYGNKEYQIYVHGVTSDGMTVCLRIMKFVPYFYVLIPEKYQQSWTNVETNEFFKYLKKRLGNVHSQGLVSKTLVDKCKLYPFENLQKHKFIRLGFCSNKSLEQCKYILSREVNINRISTDSIKFDLYETNLHSMLRFTHLRNIRMAGWIVVKKDDFSLEDDEISGAQINATAFWKQVHSYECNDIAPFLVMSYDLECYSSRGYPEFPDANIKGDIISQIGVAFWEVGPSSKIHQIVFTCVESENVITEDGVDVTIVNCKTEEEMLQKYCMMIYREDPDIITGYNIWGFDDKYLWTRLNFYGMDYYIDKMGRIIDQQVDLKEKHLSSGAYGSNTFEVLTLPGRESFDLLIAVRREHKLESFKLDFVAEYFLKKKKIDISIRMGYDTEDTPHDKKTNPYKLLFEIIKRKKKEEVAIVCDYCAHDALLPILLIDRLCLIPNYIEMSKSTRVPMDWLLFRGQQCKVFSQIVYEARLKDFVVPVFEKRPSSAPKEKFKGATVLHAMSGYYDEAVAGLDFASLYPSIMIAYNLCYSTIVIDDKYKNIPGVEYDTISWYEEEKDKNYSFTFVQNIKGVLPDILEKLWKERKQTKKEMAAAKGTFMAKVLNGKQLAIKVTMNSVYGFTGTTDGMLSCKPIAASVTAKGRQLIAQTSKLAQEMYPCVSVYGDTDSCYVKFIVDRSKFNTDELYLEEVFRLSQECADRITSEFKNPIELEFEKVMYPFYLFQKKRYVYKEWLKNRENKIYSTGVEYKGISIVRRDFCKYVKNSISDVLDALMDKKDVELAKKSIKSSVDNLFSGNVDVDDLKISNSLSATYKVKDPETGEKMDFRWDDERVKVPKPHVVVARKLKVLDPMNSPKPPDRVPYLFIENKDKNALQCDKVVHPDHIGKNKIDSMYYFEHQFKTSIDDTFADIMKNPEDLYKEVIRKKKNELAGNRDITSFFKKK